MAPPEQMPLKASRMPYQMLLVIVQQKYGLPAAFIIQMKATGLLITIEILLSI